MSRWRPTIGWTFTLMFLATFALMEYVWCRALPPSPFCSAPLRDGPGDEDIYPVELFHSANANKIVALARRVENYSHGFHSRWDDGSTHTGQLIVWDKSQRSYEVHFDKNSRYDPPAISDDCRYFASANRDENLHVLDLKTGSLSKCAGQTALARRVQFMKRVPRLVCASHPDWRLTQLQMLAVPGFAPTLPLSEEGVMFDHWNRQFEINGDETWMASVAVTECRHYELWRWNLRDGRQLPPLVDVGSVKLLPDGNSMLVRFVDLDCAFTGEWGVFDIDADTPRWTFRTKHKYGAILTISPDGRWLVMASDDMVWKKISQVELWDMSEKRRVGLLPNSCQHMMTFTPDGGSLVIYSTSDERLLCFDLPSLTERWRSGPFTGGRLQFTTNGREIVARSPRGGGLAWHDAADGRLLEKAHLDSSWLSSISRFDYEPHHPRLHLNGPLAAVKEPEPLFKLINRWTPPAPSFWQRCKNLVTLPKQAENVVQVHDVETHAELFRLNDPTTLTASLSQDGQYLATTHRRDDGGIDVFIWEVPARKSLLAMLAPLPVFAPVGLLGAWWWRRRNRVKPAPVVTPP